MKRLGLLLFAAILFIGVQAAESAINMDSLKEVIINNSKEMHDIQKDSIMISKLSPDQLLQLKREELMVQKQEIENQGRNEMPFNGMQLFFICALPFIFVPTLIYILTKAKEKESIRKYNLYTKSLEMGQSIPDHFFDEPKANASSNLKKGILWLVVGLALVVSFIVIDNTGALILGIVPTFVGIGYLLVHKLDKPKTDNTAKNDEQHG